MKNILILIALLMSNTLMADIVVSLEGAFPDYLQRLEIKEALDSLKSGESTTLELTKGSIASGEYFYAINPVGYALSCPKETAQLQALESADRLCRSITGVGTVTEIIDSKASCEFTDIFMDRRNCECRATVIYSCKITKP